MALFWFGATNQNKVLLMGMESFRMTPPLFKVNEGLLIGMEIM